MCPCSVLCYLCRTPRHFTDHRPYNCVRDLIFLSLETYSATGNLDNSGTQKREIGREKERDLLGERGRNVEGDG